MVAERILALLEAAGMSVNQLAARAGIPRATLDRHLKSTPRLLALGEIEDIADALDVTVEYLCTRPQAIAA